MSHDVIWFSHKTGPLREEGLRWDIQIGVHDQPFRNPLGSFFSSHYSSLSERENKKQYCPKNQDYEQKNRGYGITPKKSKSSDMASRTRPMIVYQREIRNRLSKASSWFPNAT
jgi:hypothetical protein